MSDTTITTNPLDATAPDPQPTIDGYFECWNAVDPTTRSATTERVWAEQARSVDPVADATGHDQLIEMFAAFHVAYPGHSFRQKDGVDLHHEFVRWGWEMLDADGNVVLGGIDVAVLADDARIEYLVGFFGAALPTVTSPHQR